MNGEERVNNLEEQYINFASKISFFEFIQDEFFEPHFDVSKYDEELALLSSNLTIEKLSKILEMNPKVFDVFEELFQLIRFTNVQYIHFCFDVNLLNNADHNTIIQHADKSIFRFENGEENEDFLKFFKKWEKSEKIKPNEKVYYIKKSIVLYIEKMMKKRNVLYCHIRNSLSSRLRISRYLIENLRADEFVRCVNLKEYLKIKRHTKDTKGIHGNFGIIKIKRILEQNKIERIDDNLLIDAITTDKQNLPNNYNNRFYYCREKKIEGILKRRDKKPKVFDFVILFDKRPVILIETNFYSTSGTKIGINQNEYVDLKNDIELFNKKHNTNIIFMWVTDGNYWLSSSGINRYKNLKRNYFKNYYELLNYNLLNEQINILLEQIRNGK